MLKTENGKEWQLEAQAFPSLDTEQPTNDGMRDEKGMVLATNVLWREWGAAVVLLEIKMRR